MARSVAYSNTSLAFDLPEERFLAAWDGPRGLDAGEVASCVRASLEAPLDFPPLEQCAFPGDRVVVAADPRVPELSTILAVVVNTLERAGVDRGSITILMTDAFVSEQAVAGVSVVAHDVDGRDSIAYLSSTESGQRVYLNRLATDADLVLPIGVIANHAIEGPIGPWSAIYPGLSNRDARRARSTPGTAAKQQLAESTEVCWLLGNQFQIGVVPGSKGVASICSGLGASVAVSGVREAEKAWTFRVDERAEAVVVGIGPNAGLDATWSALSTGSKLVRRGGKVIALSDATGPIGPASQRLASAEGFGSAAAALRGTESEPDYQAAQKLAAALAYADLYLLSGLDPDAVEEIGVIPLASAAEALRVAKTASDLILVSHAEWTQVVVTEDEA